MQALPLMQLLPNNCRAGKFNVWPSNWATPKAQVNLIWYITYRFYDDSIGRSVKVMIKGMNKIPSLKAKQQAVIDLINDELDLIKSGYNHISKQFNSDSKSGISRQTKFVAALEFAASKLNVTNDTLLDVKSCLKYIALAAVQLEYDRLNIGDVKRSHIKLLLEKTGEIKLATPVIINKSGKTKPGIWSANTFNQYRAHLSMLFSELLEYDAVDINWVTGIRKHKSIKRIRATLTPDERTLVNAHLLRKDRNFWRFLHIFFHSGSRIKELLAVKRQDVDVLNQRFKVTVKKGGSYVEEWRIIKDIALPLWMEVCAASSEDEYLFSISLIPGDKVIRREQITRRWRRHVKQELGIKADFYSLKHSNLDEVAEAIELKAAQQLAGHKTPLITLTYTTGEADRTRSRIKRVNNAFA